ncbi:zinc-ribbon domain-containing protein [Coprococcus sp. AF18-48]|nr:zinc-ribbon domain-containing protein [Coprococcus sp. AF18-48]
MKEFFEDLGKFITETAGNVGKKTEEVMEVQKLKSQIRSLERSNQGDLTDLGKIIYERFRKEEAVDGELEVICEEIRKRRMIIVAFEKKLADMKGVKECENCQELIEKDMKFCPHCGAEVKKEEMPQECEDIFAESDVSERAKMEETTEEVIEDIMEKAADVTKVSVEHVKDAASEIAEDVRESVHEVKEHIKESVEDIRE